MADEETKPDSVETPAQSAPEAEPEPVAQGEPAAQEAPPETKEPDRDSPEFKHWQGEFTRARQEIAEIKKEKTS